MIPSIKSTQISGAATPSNGGLRRSSPLGERYPRVVTEAIRARLRPVGFTALALAGTWLGHALEYGRVAGLRGLAAGLTGPAHGYMPIAGAVVLALALLLGADAMAAVRRARRRGALVRHRLRSVLRGRAAEFAFDRGPDSRPLSARALMVGLAAAQLLLYVAQENIEAGLAGSQPPGVGAIAGVHWAAPLIHIVVAALLTIIVSCVGRLVRTQEAASRRAEALIKRIVQRLGGGTGPRLPAQQSMTSRAPMPGQRRRAPPARAAA